MKDAFGGHDATGDKKFRFKGMWVASPQRSCGICWDPPLNAWLSPVEGWQGIMATFCEEIPIQKWHLLTSWVKTLHPSNILW